MHITSPPFRNKKRDSSPAPAWSERDRAAPLESFIRLDRQDYWKSNFLRMGCMEKQVDKNGWTNPGRERHRRYLWVLYPAILYFALLIRSFFILDYSGLRRSFNQVGFYLECVLKSMMNDRWWFAITLLITPACVVPGIPTESFLNLTCQ